MILLKQLPNFVTILRILCSPIIFVLLFLMGLELGPESKELWAFWIYVIAASTDWVDGTLARALDAKSELGAKLDLWADKLLVGLVIFALIVFEIVSTPNSFLLFAIAGIFLLASTSLRDYFVTDIRAKGEKFGFSLPATFLAKSKTAVIMAGIGIYLGGHAFNWNIAIKAGWIVMFIGSLMSLYTGWQYWSAYVKAKSNKGGEE